MMRMYIMIAWLHLLAVQLVCWACHSGHLVLRSVAQTCDCLSWLFRAMPLASSSHLMTVLPLFPCIHSAISFLECSLIQRRHTVFKSVPCLVPVDVLHDSYFSRKLSVPHILRCLNHACLYLTSDGHRRKRLWIYYAIDEMCLLVQECGLS